MAVDGNNKVTNAIIGAWHENTNKGLSLDHDYGYIQCRVESVIVVERLKKKAKRKAQRRKTRKR